MEIFAVRPPRGRVVHLHSPGYELGDRGEQRDRQAMCGAAIWPNGVPKMEHALAPLKTALTWTSLDPSDSDPRPAWKWCRPCLGHVVSVLDLQRFVLSYITTSGAVT